MYNNHKAKLAILRRLISSNLSYLRKSQVKLSFAKLEAQTNICIRTLFRAEHGKQLPDLHILCKLSAFYKVPVSDLVGTDLKKKAELQATRQAKKTLRDAEILARINRK